ncbi:MAG: tetratricopeptide repeat protein [Gemmatimonadales bacterium]|nr:tetratricopeptide repeat protein [Gemmatimonadales bacterium]
MTDDIRVMTAQLAADPASMVFLPLGEALRQRGQLEAAEKVAVSGLGRYPESADAHDLYARILGDGGQLEQAFDEWDIALRLDPEHVGAHKGIGFLYFVAGDLERALSHLETAARTLPEDAGAQAALARVKETLARQPTGNGDLSGDGAGVLDVPPLDVDGADPARLFAGLEGAEDGLILLDTRGLRLGGGLTSPDGTEVADAVSAHLAGVSQEAGRTARLLGLGSWISLAAESPDGHLFMVAPTTETLLLVVRERSVPLGRLAVVTERAATVARSWLEGLR